MNETMPDRGGWIARIAPNAIYRQHFSFRTFGYKRLVGSSWNQKKFDRVAQELSNDV